MRFDDIFALDISRHLDGVIKWDENAYLKSELEEYVFTPDIKRAVQQLCDTYTNPHPESNGAWISGFYGSGKSHLLKMLSYLLENADVEGKPALDYMKPKLQADPYLLASLERACEQEESESILFNIGAKAGTAERDTGKPLLGAFIKVLNERCGYAGGDLAPSIASMERDLDRGGKLDALRNACQEMYGQTWEQLRQGSAFNAARITRAYERATEQPENTFTNILEHYAKNYDPTPEDFALWVREYLDKKGPRYRLNFFVDEVGQFIANSDELLYMLQQVTESLFTKCEGRAWVFVVSQEDMDALTGPLSGRSSKDFTKIQARFKVKMKIPSNDANTVVKERLLGKKQEALPTLGRLYEKNRDDFDVLLGFPDGSVRYKLYKDEGEFAATYPLVPYQFSLFHDALVGLSNQEAFTGEYTSTGARNMLSATREVLRATKDTGEVEHGDLIPFDSMFEGLRGELKSEIFSAISKAEDHFDDPLGPRLLKALLMVKYVDSFQATPKNLRVLLYEGFSENVVENQEHIEQVLRELYAQTYVRSDGDAYEYLTDDEKDVENEIRREPITDKQVCTEIARIYQEDVLPQGRKVRYINEKFSTTFDFDLLVDGTATGPKRQNLSIELFTDLTEGAAEKYRFASSKEVLVLLPEESGLVSEVRLLLQTATYLGRNMATNDLRRREIYAKKQTANQNRRTELVKRAASLLNDAKWATNMTDITANLKGQGADRMISAADALVRTAYPMLGILRTAYDRTTIIAAATGPLLMEGEPLPEYCTEVLNQIPLIRNRASRCVIGGTGNNALESVMGSGQYGWSPEAIRQAIGFLALNGRVECIQNDKPLEGAQLANALANNTRLNEVEVRPAATYSRQQIDALKDAGYLLTGLTPQSNDAREIADGILADLKQRFEARKEAASATQRLPFGSHYQDQLEHLRKYAAKDRTWVIDEFPAQASVVKEVCTDLHAMAEFAQGKGARIFADAQSKLTAQAANIGTVSEAATKADELRALLADPLCYKNDSAPKAKRAEREIDGIVAQAVSAARQEALAGFDGFVAGFHESPDYQSAEETKQHAADQVLSQQRGAIETMDQVLALRDAVRSFKERESARLYALLATPDPHRDDDKDDAPAPTPTTVSYTSLSVPSAWANKTLTSEDDVRAFVRSLEEVLAECVRNNKRIIL